MPGGDLLSRSSSSVPVALARKDGEFRATLAWAVAADYESASERCESFLHPNELAYLRSLEFDRRKRSFLLGRLAAKQALARYLEGAIDPAAIEIVPGVFQQPVVRAGSIGPVGVSLAHSQRVACAVAYSELHPLAIDVEDPLPSRDDVIKTQLDPEELDRAAAAWPAGPSHCTMIWTAKEALSKILRCGMTCPFELLAVKELYAAGGLFGGQFANFTQYRFQTWVMGASIVSLVLPRNSELTVDMQPMAAAISR